jgi:hypothetical protein
MKAYSRDLRIRVLDALDRGTPATRSSRTAVAITFDEGTVAELGGLPGLLAGSL